MRKIVTGLFMSLDGIVEADDDWQFAYFDEELFEGIRGGWARAGATLMGRRSYEGYDALASSTQNRRRSPSLTRPPNTSRPQR